MRISFSKLSLAAVISVYLSGTIASASDAKFDFEPKKSYTYSDIYEMVDILNAGEFKLENKSSEQLVISTLVTPYQIFQTQQDMATALSSATDALFSMSGLETKNGMTILKPSESTTRMASRDNIKISEDLVVSGVLELNKSYFKVTFFKDTKVPLFTLRNMLGYVKKANGWVFSASEIK